MIVSRGRVTVAGGSEEIVYEIHGILLGDRDGGEVIVIVIGV